MGGEDRSRVKVEFVFVVVWSCEHICSFFKMRDIRAWTNGGGKDPVEERFVMAERWDP